VPLRGQRRTASTKIAEVAHFGHTFLADRGPSNAQNSGNYLAAARAEGRIGGRRKKLDASKRREIAESVVSGRKSGAEMARLYNVSQPRVSRIVARHRTNLT
jgi:hypothetical protein